MRITVLTSPISIRCLKVGSWLWEFLSLNQTRPWFRLPKRIWLATLCQKQKIMFAMPPKLQLMVSLSAKRLNSFHSILVDSGIFSKTLPAVSQDIIPNLTPISVLEAMSTRWLFNFTIRITSPLSLSLKTTDVRVSRWLSALETSPSVDLRMPLFSKRFRNLNTISFIRL